MTQLLHIFTRVILPILLMASAGYGLQKRLHLDLTAFSKALFYLILPCLVFTRLYRTTLSVSNLGTAMIFTAGIVVSMRLITLLISRIRGHKPSMRAAFGLSTMFYNSGNYGLSVAELVFHSNPFATAIQVLVFTTQNIINFTLGIFLISRGRLSVRESVRNTLRYPLIYSVALALIFRGYQIPVWQPLWISMEKMGDALIPVALIMLGAKLANTSLTHGITDVILSAICRLILGPIIAFGFIQLAHLQGMIAQMLLISASMPSAVNTALLALEFQNEPEFASQAVFFSTLLSILTVSLTIYVATVWLN